MNEVAQALHDGLDRLRERGLAKFTPCDEQGRVCARGALMNATKENGFGWKSFPSVREADLLLGHVAREQYPDRVSSRDPSEAIVDFNNHPDTTQEDVERVFEKAIVRAYEVLS